MSRAGAGTMNCSASRVSSARASIPMPLRRRSRRARRRRRERINDTESGDGIGASARLPVLHKKLDLGLKGLWGTGMGRYGDSTIADVTVKPDGKLSPLHTWSALSTVEWHATPRLEIYANYGADYVKRTSYTNLTTGLPLGYAVGLTTPAATPSRCRPAQAGRRTIRRIRVTARPSTRYSGVHGRLLV